MEAVVAIETAMAWSLGEIVGLSKEDSQCTVKEALLAPNAKPSLCA